MRQGYYDRNAAAGLMAGIRKVVTLPAPDARLRNHRTLALEWWDRQRPLTKRARKGRKAFLLAAKGALLRLRRR